MPIYFRAIPGEIADVSTLESTFREISLLGLKADQAIFDAGYFSETNISYLCKNEVNFISRMPKSRKAFAEIINEHQADLESVQYAVQYGDRAVFIKSAKISLYGYEMFAYIILDPDKKAKDLRCLMLDSLNNPNEANDNQKRLAQAGKFILISKQEMGATDVLPSYYARQSIEQIFGFAKANNHLLPLRVHSDEAISGYLLLSFITLVLFVVIGQKLFDQFTVEQALMILRNLKAKIFDSHTIVMELSRKQKNILSLLSITVPINSGI